MPNNKKSNNNVTKPNNNALSQHNNVARKDFKFIKVMHKDGNMREEGKAVKKRKTPIQLPYEVNHFRLNEANKENQENGKNGKQRDQVTNNIIQLSSKKRKTKSDEEIYSGFNNFLDYVDEDNSQDCENFEEQLWGKIKSEKNFDDKYNETFKVELDLNSFLEKEIVSFVIAINEESLISEVLNSEKTNDIFLNSVMEDEPSETSTEIVEISDLEEERNASLHIMSPQVPTLQLPEVPLLPHINKIFDSSNNFTLPFLPPLLTREAPTANCSAASDIEICNSKKESNTSSNCSSQPHTLFSSPPVAPRMLNNFNPDNNLSPFRPTLWKAVNDRPINPSVILKGSPTI